MTRVNKKDHGPVFGNEGPKLWNVGGCQALVPTPSVAHLFFIRQSFKQHAQTGAFLLSLFLGLMTLAFLSTQWLQPGSWVILQEMDIRQLL